MRFVVRFDIEGREPNYKVFERLQDARRLYDQVAAAAFSREELKTSRDFVLVEPALLFRAEAADARKAVEEVARGEAELLDREDPFELDLDEL